ncbi:MAG: peptide deformylase [Candidatus Aminicenantes bacterium]|nr:MAG: peptide deformylase [Candidatus Aminicenantes bacterium]
MSILEIVKYGDPILIKKAEKIKKITEEIEEFAQRMLQTMYAAPGLGLAAPQVGRSIQLITVDLSRGENNKNSIILANPEIINKEGEVLLEEGCLSIPDIQEKVLRPARIVIKGIDPKGDEKIIEAEGLLARAFCHEIDHVNGTLFIDRLSPLKKGLIRKKLKKRIQAGKIS